MLPWRHDASWDNNSSGWLQFDAVSWGLLGCQLISWTYWAQWNVRGSWFQENKVGWHLLTWKKIFLASVTSRIVGFSTPRVQSLNLLPHCITFLNFQILKPNWIYTHYGLARFLFIFELWFCIKNVMISTLQKSTEVFDFR